MPHALQAIGQYIGNWLRLLSQAANTLVGGDPRMTLSARMGHDVIEGNCRLCAGLCKFLNLFDADHCEKSWGDELVAPDPVSKILND